jgi:hypothetical protein
MAAESNRDVTETGQAQQMKQIAVSTQLNFLDINGLFV